MMCVIQLSHKNSQARTFGFRLKPPPVKRGMFVVAFGITGGAKPLVSILSLSLIIF